MYQSENNKFIIGDARKLDIPSGSIDLIITHPPYLDIDVERYKGDPQKQINFGHSQIDMLSMLVKSTKEMERVLKPNGSLFICIGDQRAMPYLYLAKVLKKTKLHYLGFTTWDYNVPHSFLETMNGSQVLWFHLARSSSHLPFNRNIKKRDWGLGPGINNNIGQLLDQELEKEGVGFLLDTYPIGLAHKFIQLYTRPEDTVLDPFGGSGVTAQAAVENKRNFITNDISEEMTKSAQRRIELYSNNPTKYGTLRLM